MDSAVERLRPVLLFGGTTEGRELAARLAGRGQRTILCVATDYGREVLEPELLANPCLDVRIGRMDAEEMRHLILEEEPGLVVDPECAGSLRKDRPGILAVSAPAVWGGKLWGHGTAVRGEKPWGHAPAVRCGKP